MPEVVEAEVGYPCPFADVFEGSVCVYPDGFAGIEGGWKDPHGGDVVALGFALIVLLGEV